MAVRLLPHHLKQAGYRLLIKLDELGLRPQGAAWFYSHMLEEWQYHLFTVVVDELGVSRVYDKLIEVWPKLGLPDDFDVTNVYISSPYDDLYSFFGQYVTTDNTDGVEFQNVILNGVRFDAVVYRIGGHPEHLNAQATLSTFARRARKLAAAPA